MCFNLLRSIGSYQVFKLRQNAPTTCIQAKKSSFGGESLDVGSGAAWIGAPFSSDCEVLSELGDTVLSKSL